MNSYHFSSKIEPHGSAYPGKDVLGGKGANLARMASMKLPVPPGFILPCALSIQYHSMNKADVMASIEADIKTGLQAIDEEIGVESLVSVRSGAPVSMPGMMDTILNVGLTSSSLPLWVKRIGERAAYDSYRRLLQMFGSVALGVPMAGFDKLLNDAKQAYKAKSDSDLTPATLHGLCDQYKALILSTTGKPMPDTREEQVRVAIAAVFDSWNNDRANEYRKINNIPYSMGTAVVVQAMVFGNLNDKSATGVLFTRDPSTGQRKVTGEFLVNAQGEDVVAGIRTPEPLSQFATTMGDKVWKQLHDTVTGLENVYRDMQDVEFTVQDGTLYMLQTRTAKRSALAAFRVAAEMYDEGLISSNEVAERVTREQLFTLLRGGLSPDFKKAPTVKGIAAGGGPVVGRVFLSSADLLAFKATAQGKAEPVILVSEETTPDDIAAMHASVGILTRTGGLTSHAAVVARGMDKSCVVGTTDLNIGTNMVSANGATVAQGHWATIDGSTGNVWLDEKAPMIEGGTSDLILKVASIVASAKEPDAVQLIAFSQSMSANDMAEQIKDHAIFGRVAIDLMAAVGPYGMTPVAMSNFLTLMSTAINLAAVPVTVVVEPRKSPDQSLSNLLCPKTLPVDEVLKMIVTHWSCSSLVTLQADIKNPAPFLSKGYKLAAKASKVRDLFEASGPLLYSPGWIDEVFGTETAFKLVVDAALKVNPGLKLVTGEKRSQWFNALTA